MTKNRFIETIRTILNSETIEGVKINNNDNIKKLLGNEKLTNKLYQNFKDNYTTMFGDDNSMFITKTQDFVYRLNLLFEIINNNTGDFNNIILDEQFDLYSAVSYNAEEDREILEDYYLTLKELTSLSI